MPTTYVFRRGQRARVARLFKMPLAGVRELWTRRDAVAFGDALAVSWRTIFVEAP